MIKGNNIQLKMFDQLKEIKIYVDALNDLENRSELDRTDFTSQAKLIKLYEED